jgi:hypothetical protein
MQKLHDGPGTGPGHIHEDEQLDEAQFTAWVEANQPIADYERP